MMPPPLGDSSGAAVTCAVAFLLLGIGFYAHAKYLAFFHLYMLLCMSALVRGIAMAIRAVTIHDGESSVGKLVVYYFFTAAGVGMSIAAQCFVLAGWLQNTAAIHAPPRASSLRVCMLSLVPVVIAFGPVLGITSALLVYTGSPTAQDLDHGQHLRQAAAVGMLVVASITAVSGAVLSWHAWSTSPGRVIAPAKYPHQLVVVVVPTSLLLVWSAGFRVASVTSHPEIVQNEKLLFPLQVLPELLQLCIWVGRFWYAQAHMSSQWDDWRAQRQSGGNTGPQQQLQSTPQLKDTQKADTMQLVANGSASMHAHAAGVRPDAIAAVTV